MSRSFRLSLTVITVALLAGCQQSPKKTPPPVATQLEQLSSLLASSQFLRQHCARSDIPDDVQLQRSAIGLAEQRGWNTAAVEYQQLTAGVQSRYQALVQDSTPENEKCTTLNRSTARFISDAQSR